MHEYKRDIFTSIQLQIHSFKYPFIKSFIMPNTQTVDVPHLGGITAAYQSSGSIDKSKPTLVLVNSFTASSELYADALKNPELTNVMNLVAIELLGHGQTRAHKTENWTYWDTAIMNLQVMEKLGVDKAFVLGTSQGGWITVRMALLAPEKVRPDLISKHVKKQLTHRPTDPRHNPPRHIPRLRIRPLPLPRLLARRRVPRQTRHRRLQHQELWLELQTAASVHQLPHRHWLRQGLPERDERLLERRDWQEL